MPDVHNAISTTRCKLFPIGRPGYRKEAIRMTTIGTLACSANSLPDLDSLIARARGDITTIGGPCYGEHLVAMAMIDNFTRHTQNILVCRAGTAFIVPRTRRRAGQGLPSSSPG